MPVSSVIFVRSSKCVVGERLAGPVGIEPTDFRSKRKMLPLHHGPKVCAMVGSAIVGRWRKCVVAC